MLRKFQRKRSRKRASCFQNWDVIYVTNLAIFSMSVRKLYQVRGARECIVDFSRKVVYFLVERLEALNPFKCFKNLVDS